ncbi:MAG: ATP-binding cassette domain-containing protein [Betaproteobacteria bacterium]|nr:ATP-binding cassette domain-containing protein [Betaproteobacteria bacterium]
MSSRSTIPSAAVNHSPVVVFNDVRKTFAQQQVLRGLSFELQRGEISFIIGRSGEGKSVTIKHIIGVLHPDSGEIFVNGEKLTHAPETKWIEARRNMGLLFQDGALFDSMSVGENVAFPIREFEKLTPKELTQRVDSLLELVGLPGYGNAKVPDLSIGQRKRVGLARALALNPSILLYDEPTTGMDPLISELIDSLIIEMQQKIPGLSSVVISHDIQSVLRLADRIFFLHEGKMYATGRPVDFTTSTDPVIRQFITGSLHGPLGKPIA